MNRLTRYFAKRLSSRVSYPLCKPKEITIVITNKCNFRCTHCDVWRTKFTGRELETSQWKEIIKNLANWLGSFRLILSGGEPLLRQDIFEILAYCRFLGIYTVINTNGYLIDKKIAKRIVDYVNEVKLSLYATGKKHNKLRNIEKAYEHAVAAVKNIKRADRKKSVIITIALLLNSETIDNLKTHLEWIRKNNLQLLIQVLDEKRMLSIGDNSIEDNPLWQEQSELWPTDRKKIHQAFRTIEYFREKRGLRVVNSEAWLKSAEKYFVNPEFIKKAPCYIAYDSILINAFGRALFCFESGAIDDLTVKKDIKKLWSSEYWKQRRLKIANCERFCRVKCNYAAKIYDYL